MADDPINDRMKKFEAALDPAITKFAPKNRLEPIQTAEVNPVAAPLSALVEMLRAHGKGILDLANQIESHVDGSEESMRKAIDNLMDTIKRVK